jgi:hypothetical protein
MEELRTTIVFLAVCVPFFVGTVWAILDVAQRDYPTVGQKARWWVIASIPFFGFIVYFALGARKGKKQ